MELLSEMLGDAIDFPAVGETYDAIHMTSDGQWATRLSRPGLYGWDCESTLWLRDKFTAEYIGPKHFWREDRSE